MVLTFFRWTSVNLTKRTRTGYGRTLNGRWIKRVEKDGQRTDREVREDEVPDAVMKEYDEVLVF